MGWDREVINKFLADGGDIKEVDKFLRSGGQITRPNPEIIPDNGSSDIRFGDDYLIAVEHYDYLEASEPVFAFWEDKFWAYPGGRCPDLDWYDNNIGRQW